MIQPALKSIYEKKKVIKTKVHSQLFTISRKKEKEAAHITFPRFSSKALCGERNTSGSLDNFKVHTLSA